MADNATMGSRVDKDKPVANVNDVCPKHEGKIVDIYCKECCLPICSMCYDIDHIGHIYSDLKDDKIRQDFKYEYATLITRILKRIKEFEGFSESLNEIKCDLDDSVTTACAKVDQQVVKMCTQHKRHGESIKDVMKNTCGKGNVGAINLTKQMEDTKRLTMHLKVSLQSSVKVLDDNSIVPVIHGLKKLRHQEKECSARKFYIPEVPKLFFRESEINPSLGTVVRTIFEHGFTLDEGMLHTNYVVSPKFMYSGEQWQVGVWINASILSHLFGYNTLSTGLLRLTGNGDYTCTVKLVNRVDDQKSITKTTRKNRGTDIIYWSDLRDRNNGYLLNNIFTIELWS